MKSYSLFILACLIAHGGFSQQTISSSITHDNLQRDYILYLPANYDGASTVPLVLNFHGYTSNAEEQMRYGDFRTIADTAGFLLVHPQGTRLNGVTHWNVGGWTIGSTTDDVGFTAALIDSLSAQYNIDPDRIYATGMSNGGFMSFLLACQLSDRIAAVASVTGSMTPQIYDNCSPQHPTPIMQIHGTVDGVVPYLGASWTRSIAQVLDYWRAYNNCSDEPNRIDIPNTSLLDASTATHTIYAQGDNGSTVEHFRISGGGHTWPGSAIPAPGTNQDFDASLEIWKFFSRYDLGRLQGPTSIHAQPSQETNLLIFPNPTHRLLTIDVQSAATRTYQLHSMQGQLLKRGLVTAGSRTLDLAGLPNGIYMLQLGNQGFKIVKQ